MATDPQNNAPEGKETAARPRGPATEVAVMLDQIDILPSQRLRHLDQGPVMAYAARERGHGGPANYFALVCEPGLVPRIRRAGNFSGIVSPSLVKLVKHGVAYWTPARGERYAFVYENNLGQPLMNADNMQGLGWKQEKVINAVIKPMVNVLLDMRDSEVFHGAIRPANMFDGGAKVIEKVVLGECLSTPVSFTQPVVFESIERAMCHPLGRGRGGIEDDLYAFGVSLSMLMRQHDPLEGMSEEEIIKEKIEKGSYGALTAKDRFTGGILELLRGLLYDDRAQRWSLEDILSWLDGQRLSPKQSVKKIKAPRPMPFNGERYLNPVLLSMDLGKKPSEAVQIIDNGDLEQWIVRSLEDSQTKERMDKAVKTSQELGRGPGYWDRLVSRVSVALDPGAPIRFRELHFNPEGFPLLLAHAVWHKKDLQPFADVVSQQMVTYWLDMQTVVSNDVGTTVSRYENCRAFLRQVGNVAYGIERCLYFLLPDCPCYSDKLRNYCAHSPEAIVLAFNDMADQPGRPDLFIDRHIASFISVHDRRVLDPYLSEINAPEPYKKILGNIKVLATIQQRSRLGPLPKLSNWVVDLIEPTFSRFHNRDLAKKLREQVEKLRNQGDIGKIIATIDNFEMKQQDFEEFQRAMMDFAKLREEATELEAKLERPEIFARETGREYAAVFSSILSGIVILIFAFIYLTKGTIF